MEIGQDIPIVSVCVISDPTKLPPNYTLIDKTLDRSDDADMWKDRLWGRRVMRYLCVQRKVPTSTEDVLIDASIINERDEPPPGFTVVETTQDSEEKATKKRLICLRWMVPTMTNDAITELVFINQRQKRAPPGYTMVGDINNISLCYKMGRIPSPTTTDQQSGDNPGLSYNMNPTSLPGLPYNPIPPTRSHTASSGLGVNTSFAADNQLPAPMSPQAHISPLTGVQWKMNPRYGLMMKLQNLTIPEIRGKTREELDRQYTYTFEVEMSVSKASMVS